MKDSTKALLHRISIAATSLLTTVAILPYTMGDLANIIPPAWKLRVTLGSAIAAFLLRAIGAPTPTPPKP